MKAEGVSLALEKIYSLHRYDSSCRDSESKCNLLVFFGICLDDKENILYFPVKEERKKGASKAIIKHRRTLKMALAFFIEK